MKKVAGLVFALSVVGILLGGANLDRALAVTEDFKVTASDGLFNSRFGFSAVSIDGNTMAVSARYVDDEGERFGSVYIYRFNGTNWLEEAVVTASDAVGGDTFGGSVSLSGNVLVVGAISDDDNGIWSGAAYVFRYDGANWVKEVKLKASDGAAEDLFGSSVSATEDLIVIGSHGDDDGGVNTGSVYVYRFNGASWVEEAKLKASDAKMGDLYGASVSADKEVVIVGTLGSSSVYIYRFNGTSWVEEAKLLGGEGNFFWISSLSVSGDVVVFAEEDGFGISAYAYRFNGTTWVQEAQLTDERPLSFDAGNVDVSGNIIVVGDASSGVAFVYRHDGTNWIEEDELTASDDPYMESFAHSVSVNREVIAVGAPFADGVAPSSGAVYVYGFPCREANISDGIILDSFTPQRAAFSINLEGSTTSLADMLADFDTKTVHIQVGPLELDIPGNLFVRQRNGNYVFNGSVTGSSGYFSISLNPSGRARLRGIRTNLDDITNPIPVSIAIDGTCWRSDIEWRESAYPGGVIYRFP